MASSIISDNSGESIKLTGGLHLEQTCPLASEGMCCEFNCAGSLLAVGEVDASVQVFQPSTGKPLYHLKNPRFDKLPVTAVRFLSSSPDNVLMVAYSSGTVCHWHISTGQCLSTISELRQTLAAVFAPDELSFATTGSDAKIYIYDQKTTKRIHTLESSMSFSLMDGHVSRVFALAYHPIDPRILLSAGWDDSVQFWDTRQAHSVRRISGPHVCGDALDIEPRTLNIITGSWRHHDPVQVWDFDSGKLISAMQLHTPMKLYTTKWVTDDCLLLGGSQKNQAILLQLSSNKVLGMACNFHHGVYDVDFSKTSGEFQSYVAGSHLYIASSHRITEY